MSLNILFISVDTIKDRTGLHNNVDDKLILPEIKAAQDIYILPALGSALYNRLQAGIQANDLTQGEVTLLNDYIVDTLVNFVLSELPQGLSFQYYNKGLLKKTGDNFESTSMQDMIDVANRYKSRAEFYKQRLIKYLKQQSSIGNFPLYLNWGSGIDVVRPEHDGYNSTIYLGDDTCCEGKPVEKNFKYIYQGNNPLCCYE
jgi:hypothetical protein